MKTKKILSFACAFAIAASMGAPYAFAIGSTSAGARDGIAVEQAASKTKSTKMKITKLTAEEAKAQGYDQLLKGTVRVLDAYDTMKLEGCEKYADMFEGEYVTLVFDEPTKVTAINIGTRNPITVESHLLGLTSDRDGDPRYSKDDDGNVEPWREYDGKRISVAIKGEKCLYASEINPFVENPIGNYEAVAIVTDAS